VYPCQRGAGETGRIEVPVQVTVCVGSSCHVRGSRAVLTRFAEIIKEEDPKDHVSLVGSFCLERCGECMNWKFNDEDISSRNVEEAEQTLRARLREADGGG
jgi:NADH-quinone oxidoreductase subunit G